MNQTQRRQHVRRLSLYITAYFNVAAILFVSSTCAAQTLESAKEKFEDGVMKFKTEDYNAALKLFKSSYELNSKPIVLFNIGMCQKALFYYTESMRTFQQIKLMDPSMITPFIRESVEDAVNEIKMITGKLLFTDVPDTAVVQIDNIIVGTTPFSQPLLLSPGKHMVHISKEKHTALKKEVTIDQGSVVSLQAMLPLEMAAIEIICPTNASVSINGILEGSCPIKRDIPPGEYTVRIEAVGKKPFIRSISAVSGHYVTMNAALEIDLHNSKLDSLEYPAEINAMIPNGKVTPTKKPVLFAGGIVCSSLGAAAIGIGIAFSFRRLGHYNDVIELADQVEQAKDDENRALYSDYWAQYAVKKEEYKNESLPKDRAGMLSGYITGGLFIAAGLTMIFVGRRKKRSSADAVVFPSVTGVSVVF